MEEERLSIDAIQERILAFEKAAHVTFYVVAHESLEGWYFVYSDSKGQGLQVLSQQGHPAAATTALHHLLMHQHTALDLIKDLAQRLEQTIAKKRLGMPTAKQVYFLFRHQIPIPLDLTWGQASDLIDEQLSQIEYEKEQKEKAKAEKPRVAKQPPARLAPFHKDDNVTHPTFGPGIVLHAGNTLAGVQFQDRKELVNLTELAMQEIP